MKVFDKPGKENSRETMTIGIRKAMELETDIVISSGTGESALMLLDLAQEMGYRGHIVVVRTNNRAALNGGNKMLPERKQEILNRGASVVTAAHALSGGERSLSAAFKGQYPLEIMAAALRMFGQGTKVTVEISVMALDADEIPYGRPVVAMGGTSFGVDTAAVVTPSYAAAILNTKVNEILCKPGFYPAGKEIVEV